MYAKCSGSPWLLQIPAEEDEGKGKLRWEVEAGRPSLFDQRANDKCCVT